MKLSGTVGSEKEEESRRVMARAVGEVPGVSLEESGGYGDVNGREAVVEYGSRGKRNVTGTTYGSSVLPRTN